MRNHSLRQSGTFTPKILLSALVLFVVCHSSAWAQTNSDQQWWFNVELIVFKRTLLSTNNENFEQEQFELEIANSNNLLYLETLKPLYQFEPLNEALPACSAKHANDGKYGVNFNFEYIPKNTQLEHDNIDAIALESTTVLNSEDSLNDNISVNPDSYLVSPIISNLSIMNALLVPLILESTNKVPDVGTDIEPLSNVENDYGDTGVNTRQINKDTLDNIERQLREQMTQSEETPLLLSCLQNQAKQMPLSETALTTIGPNILSKSAPFMGTNQVISLQELALQDYANQVFKQRDIQPLLYTAWRQQVKFGIENAEFYRVRAGNRLETSEKLDYETWDRQRQFNAIIEPQADESVFFQNLQQALEINEPVDWLTTSIASEDNTNFVAQRKYELEGLLKVYLDYVNQVPYLHIDNQFNLNKLVLDQNGSSALESYPLKQRRRIISKQIHYFDHPAFGLIIRLERFTPPIIEESENEELLVENTYEN